MAMYDHSRQIMRRTGNRQQWIGGYPSENQIKADIQSGVSHIIESGGEAIGVFAFIIGRDHTYNEIRGGAWESDERPYGTLHRLACAEGQHGIFGTCIEWCRRQMTSLRIDTHEDNAIMRHLIEKYGFKYRGIIQIDDGSDRLAYQMTETGVLCEPLRDYLCEEVLPVYATFDKAHQTDHAERVIENSLQLAEHHDVEINMVYTIAAYHDVGLTEGRERHHLVSGERMRSDKALRQWFTSEQIETMAEAVEDHRASGGAEPRSIYGKIVAEADRDIEPMKIICRAVQYGLSNYPELDREAQRRRAVEHLEEKYGVGGYMKLWLKESPNAAKLEELRKMIADRGRLEETIDAIFEVEKMKKEE